jgi:hypothetical protein
VTTKDDDLSTTLQTPLPWWIAGPMLGLVITTLHGRGTYVIQAANVL